MTENGVFIKKEGRIYRTIVSNRNIWEDFSVKTTIQKTLRALGITRNYDGYRLILAAVQLAVEDEDRLRLVTKEIYRPVSILCCCPLANVERNIRTVIRRAWHVNRAYLNTLAGYPVEQTPTVTQFVEMLSGHILRKMRKAL